MHSNQQRSRDRYRRSRTAIYLAAFAGSAALTRSANGQITFLNQWGSHGIGDGQFDQPEGVALGPAGTVYVTDDVNDREEIFSSTGAFLSTFGTSGTGNGQFLSPTDAAVNSAGTVYVTDSINSRVEVFDSFNNFQFGVNTGSPGLPSAMAVDPNGKLYVVDQINYKVDVYNFSGVLQSAFGSQGSGNGQFGYPTGVAVGPTGTVYVVDNLYNRVEFFNSQGIFQGTLAYSSFNDPANVAVSSTGTAYVTDFGNNRVEVFNSAGAPQGSFGSQGAGNGQFNSPYGVTVSPSGNVYIADTINNRIERFFDPSSWASGTNYFLDPSLGPTSLALGPGSVLGSTLTINSSMGLVVGNALTITSTGSLTQTGGILTTTTFNINGSFNYQGGGFYAASAFLNAGGSLTASSFTIGAGQSFSQTGGTFTPGNLTVAGSCTLTAGTFNTPSSLVVSPGGSFYAPSLALYAPFDKTLTVSGGPITVDTMGAGLSGFFQATQGGQLVANTGFSVSYGGEAILDGGTSLSTATVSMQGGLLVLGDATLNVTTSSAFRCFSGTEVQLENPNLAIIQTPQFDNESGALLDGSGRINGQLQNFLGAEVSVATGQSMAITGSGNSNGGLISLTGGQLHFTQDLTNNGSVEGTGTLRVDNGLTNNGIISVGGLPTYLFGTINNKAGANMNLAGTSYVFGNVTNAANATVHLSGLTNVFYGTFANSGNLNVDLGASGLLYGAYSGNGPIVNNGFLYIDATSIAGQITGGGTITLGSAGVPTQLHLLPLGQTSTQSGVAINSGSTLDIANNAIRITYGSPANDPVTTIKQYLTTGYNGGAWTGTGISSSTAAAGTNPALSVGYADGNFDGGTPAGPNQILVKYTLAGDANLDGFVNFADLVAVIQNFNKSNTDWAHGNFTYGASTNFNDLVAVVQNFNKTLNPAGSTSLTAGGSTIPLGESSAVHTDAVPEPGALGFIAAAAAGLLARRRPKEIPSQSR